MNIQAIRAIAEQYRATVTGDLGVAFTDLKTGEGFTINGDKEMPTASTFKVYLLAEFLRQCEEGKYALTDRHELKAQFVSPGSGILDELQPGLNLTLLDYARLMMMLSDNTATDYLYHLTGLDNIQKNVIQGFGLDKTKCDYPCKALIAAYFDPAKKVLEGERNWRCTADYLCTSAENDSTSPENMEKVLRLVYEDKLFSPWVSQQMVDIMKRCHTNSRIPKHLPRGIEVAHKTGTMDKVANDVGIVYTEKGDYILCLFYNGNVASQEEYDRNVKGSLSDSLLAEISRDIYAEYVK